MVMNLLSLSCPLHPAYSPLYNNFLEDVRHFPTSLLNSTPLLTFFKIITVFRSHGAMVEGSQHSWFESSLWVVSVGFGDGMLCRL